MFPVESETLYEEKWSFFVDVINRWPLNLSDWINLAAIQDLRDDDPGHARIQTK